MKTLEIVYSIGDVVRINALARTGTVNAHFNDGHALGLSYRVRYFVDDKPQDVYFYAHELMATESDMLGDKYKSDQELLVK